jgi:hypothetical protein
MYAIFSVPPDKRSKADEILKDDIVSRQSIVLRDCSTLGLKDLGLLILIEGEETAVKRSQELFKDLAKRLEGAQAVDVYERFKKETDEVASGVGFIFG